MAELGQTNDPKELVPGEPEAVNTVADELRKRAKTMEDVADGLAGVRIPDWTGPASSAFWQEFTPEAGNWRLGRDAMNTAAGALDAHASSLTWAQRQAAEAIALWQRGEQATQQAIDSGELSPLGTQPGVDPLGVPTNPLTAAADDPGAGLRQQAQAILQRARDQLDKAGDAHAAAIDKVAGRHGGPGWLTGPADFVQKRGMQKVAGDIKATESWLEKAQRQQGAGSRFAKYGQWGHEFDQKTGPKVTVAGARVQGNLFGTYAQGATQVGDVTLVGRADAKALGGEAIATAGIGPGGVNAQARATAYLAQVSAQGSAHLGPAELGGSGKAFVGADAGVDGTFGTHGVNVGADAFAGAKATGEVHGDIGGLGAGATGEAWAGVGAEAHATFGEGDDGKWHIGGEAGLGLGVGGKVGFEFTVDPGEVTDALGDAASALNPFD
jgi:type VII secretion system ESX-1 substrate